MKKSLIFIFFIGIALTVNAQVIDKVKGVFMQKEFLTEEDLSELEFSDVDLSQVIFYTSSEISIQRNIPRDAKIIGDTEGNVTFNNGKVMSKVFITKGATGIITQVYADSIKVKFENKEGYLLTFVKDKRLRDTSNCYYLQVSEDRTIRYGPYDWYLNWGNSVCLQWKNKEIKKTTASRKKIRGVKPDGSERKTFKKHFIANNEELTK